MAAVVATIAVLSPAVPVQAGPPDKQTVDYRPPVDAPVTDPFRPPPEPWLPGNRGLQYATAPATPVRAAAAGDVVFSGPVGGALHAVILHPDGIRTSYSFLESIAVHRGDRVEQGGVVGTAGERLHFGARAGHDYIDPAQLFAATVPRVYLVAEEQRRASTEAEERSGLLRSLAGAFRHVAYRATAAAVSATADGVDWARRQGARAALRAAAATRAAGSAARRAAWSKLSGRLDELRGVIHYVRALHPVTVGRDISSGMARWWRNRRECTPEHVVPPKVRPGERKVVLVAGLGSNSESAAVYGVDTVSLGYAPEDVVRFSYRGGTTADNRYTAADTTVDLRRSGRRLWELLERLAAHDPGTPIDIIAHSQGGLVARTALAYEYDANHPGRPSIGSLVTIGSPHQGADGATALAMAAHTRAGKLLQQAAHAVRPHGPDPTGISVRQMAETSEFMRRLSRRRLPAQVWATSIGGRDDLIVAGGRTRLAGAHNVVVSAPGLPFAEHSKLPRSHQAQREVGLALARLPPTCQKLFDAVADVVVSTEISLLQDGIGAAAWAGGRWVERYRR